MRLPGLIPHSSTLVLDVSGCVCGRPLSGNDEGACCDLAVGGEVSRSCAYQTRRSAYYFGKVWDVMLQTKASTNLVRTNDGDVFGR